MIRRTINWRVLAVSLGTAVGLAVSLYLLQGWQLRRLAKALLEVARSRDEQGKWHEAVIYFDRYLRVHPTEVAVRCRLAETYAKGAHSSTEKTRAVELHYRAIAAGPTDADAILLRSRLSRLLVETGRFGEAEREARQVISKVSEQPEAARTLAVALFAQWENGSLATVKLDEIRLLSTVEKARRLNPADATLAEITAYIYRDHANIVAAEFSAISNEERQRRADACLDELVLQSGREPKDYLARFRYRSRYQLPGAEDDLAKALELGPENPDVLLTAAKSAQQKAGRAKDAGLPSGEVALVLEQARDLYRKLQADNETTLLPDSYFGLGDVQLALDEIEQAISAWRTGLKRFAAPTIQIAFLSRIADALLQANRGAEATDSLDAIDTLVSLLGSSVARDERLTIIQAQDLRRASWHLQREEIARAMPLLQEVIARQGSGTSGNATAALAWKLLGRANAQIGEWREAAVAFDRAAPLDPTSYSTKIAAGYAWLQISRPDLAVERAEQSLAIQPTAEAMMILATAEYEKQNILPAKQRSWKRLERTLGQLEQDPRIAASLPSPWRIDFLRADLAVSRGSLEGEELGGRNEGIASIAKAETKYSDNNEFWRTAALAYQRLGDLASADRALSCYAALTNSPAERAIAKSRLAVLRRDFAVAQQTLEEAEPQASMNERSALRRELIEVAFAGGDLALAERLLAIEAQERPSDVNVLRRACELAMQRSDSAAVVRWQRALVNAGALGDWWARYFGAIQLVAGAKDPQDLRLGEALEEVNKLIVIRPHWPMSHALRGTIEQRRGRLEEAANAFEHAIQLGERRFSVFEQLIAILDRLNRTAEAEHYLSRLENYMPFSQRLTEIATNYELRRDHPEQAIELARAAVAKRPDDPYSHLWLARLLLVNRKLVDAEFEFKKSLELAPEDVRAWNGLFTFYLRSGKPEQARQTLDELQEKAKLTVADRSFVLAQGYELLGDWKNAASQYEKATATTQNRANVYMRLAGVQLRNDPEKAEQSLRTALKVEPTSAPARRMLAALLATRSNPAEFQEAESLLRVVDPTTSTVAVEDRRLNALLLAQQGDARQTAKAVEILEGVIAKPVDSTPGDRLILARIYESQARSSADPASATAKRSAALEQLQAVASQPDAQPAHLAALIDYFLRNSQPNEAGSWLEKFESLLESRTQDEPGSIAQLIELRIRHGSGDRCQKWLNRLSASDADPLRPTALQANWLASQDRTGEIEALVEPVAAKTVAVVTDDRERGRRAKLIGDLYLATKQTAQAERWYRTAAGYDPAQFPTQVRALALSNQIADAIRLCLDRASGDATSRPAIVLASALAEVNSHEEIGPEADGFLSSALEQHPKDAKLLYAIATLRAVQGRYDEAIRHYRSVLALEPKNISALNNLAMVLAEAPEGRTESLKLINQAIDLVGQHPGLLDTKGAILIYQGEAKQALFLLEAAAREAGNDARHRFHLAAAYQGVGDPTKARQQLQSAIAQNLEQQVLTPTDRRILSDLKAALIP